MNDKFLRMIEKEKAKYEDCMQMPASDKKIDTLKKKAAKDLGYAIDEGYSDFLKEMDGLDWNGHSVYATEISKIAGYENLYINGFVEANLQYWESEPNKTFITYGESNDSRFVFNIENQNFQEIDKVSLDDYEDFNSFEEMLTFLLKSALGLL